MTSIFRRLPLIAAAAALAFASVASVRAQDPDARPDFGVSPLSIETQDGRSHDFTVEIADDASKRAYGLMFVRELADDRGMLFDYGREQRVSMWMKNTYIPLDMLFIEANGEIESIIERATPHSLQPRASKGRVRGVLELKGGAAARLGIEPGDRVRHPRFQ
ncbi:MAG: DUF192 domain-containing protein [Marivibrio sp.]|uniref:DUF192 domain-containing protein n=1 Tax=Marivibrio sp. TaxID=2039719 RepID=UPI0032F00D23